MGKIRPNVLLEEFKDTDAFDGQLAANSITHSKSHMNFVPKMQILLLSTEDMIIDES